MKRRKAWNEYPLRTCRWVEHCAICEKSIISGEKYRDGGYSRRAHEECVLKVSAMAKRLTDAANAIAYHGDIDGDFNY